MAKCSAPAFARMDKKISLQSLTQSLDAQGGFTDSWATVATVWAHVEPLKASEMMLAQQTQAQRVCRFTIRYTASATHATRIAYGGRLFDIKEVINPGERNHTLVIRAAELAA